MLHVRLSQLILQQDSDKIPMVSEQHGRCSLRATTDTFTDSHLLTSSLVEPSEAASYWKGSLLLERSKTLAMSHQYFKTMYMWHNVVLEASGDDFCSPFLLGTTLRVRLLHQIPCMFIYISISTCSIVAHRSLVVDMVGGCSSVG